MFHSTLASCSSPGSSHCSRRPCAPWRRRCGRRGRISIAALQAGSRRASGAGRRTRDVLMVVEVAFSVTLVAVSVLLIQSLLAVQQAPLGFDQSNVFTLQFRLPQNKYPKPENIARLLQERHRKRACGAWRRIRRARSCGPVQRQRRHDWLCRRRTSGTRSGGGAAGAVPYGHARLLQDDENSAAEGKRLHGPRRPSVAAGGVDQRHLRQTDVAGRRSGRQALHDPANSGPDHRDWRRRRYQALHGNGAGGAAAVRRALSGALDLLAPWSHAPKVPRRGPWR